jgi:O6-methylguanine-DNA--protein-cysteine methyltransferase
MDDALLKVVEANKLALQKLTDGGANFEESSVKKGLKELEAFEEKFLDGVKNAVQSSSDPIKQQWKSILDKIPRGGTETGAQVAETISARAREAQVAMQSSREAGLKAMHAITQNYATLVSGVLIGLSEAFEQGKRTKR